MTLREKQHEFFKMICRLGFYAEEKGLRICIGELYRTIEKQKELLKIGRTQTLNSLHLKGLAVDFHILKDDGSVDWDFNKYKILGEYWKQLGGEWGGDWKTLRDGVHFQYKEKEK